MERNGSECRFTEAHLLPMNTTGLPADTPFGARALWEPADQAGSTWSELLCVDPIVIHALPSIGFPLGSASAIGPLIRGRRAHFLIMPAWTIEPPGSSQYLIDNARSYLRDHPHHQLIFLGNTERERQIMAEAGFEAVALNQNCLLNDAVFRPIPDIESNYDAVYNARLSSSKRPELAAEVERLALLYFYDSFELSVPQFHAEHARLQALMPRASFINEITPQGCEWLPPHRVNELLARSRVGLCLSPLEGAMRAAVEYLFAGLSVVSTPSLGGRDHYFDDEYCIIAEPNPRSIREAVDALVARAIPRDVVRAKTLARVEADRARYIALVQGLIDRTGSPTQFADRFWSLVRGQGILRWRSMGEFATTVAAALAT
jgi:glycosyltransferase involved in cell wall biosynthesis